MSTRWIFFDLEGTGPDPYFDRIVEMAFYEVLRGKPSLLYQARVNPGCMIPEEASKVHGIYDADVADCDTFDRHAAEVQQLVEGAVLVGYNLRRYDTILLDRELRMADRPGFERGKDGRITQPEVDPYAIWCELEPRNLAAAAKRFAGTELEDAHAAGADAEILPALLKGMIAAFSIEPSLSALLRLSKPAGEVDRDRKFLRDEEGIVRFNFGNKKGWPVSSEPGLLRWICDKDFSPETKAYARQFLEEIYGGDP